MDDVVLIATNGFEGSWPAIEYGAWVAEALGLEARLLGILETADEAGSAKGTRLDAFVDRAVAHFKEKGLRHTVDRQQGRVEELLPREAGHDGGLTVIGPLGRPALQRLLVGRSIRRLLETVPTPLLYVPTVRLPLSKMLVCLGGLGYEITAEHVALRLGAAAGAEIILLHVALPVNLEYPTSRVERDRWRDLETTDSLLGRNLRAALEVARREGLRATLKARQGDVVEEILAELKTGGYDLVCMGSAYGMHGLRQLYEPHVTDEVAERATCPVLTARFSPGSSNTSS